MCVYFIKNPETGLIKIGTAKNVFARVFSLMSQHKTGLRILGLIDGDVRQEKKLHRRFADYNNYDEWFNPSEAILNFIDQNCNTTYSTKKGVRPKSIEISVKSNVPELAKKMGITDYWQLAWASGVTPSACENLWRHDPRNARLSVMIKVSRVLGCTIDDLFEFDGDLKF